MQNLRFCICIAPGRCYGPRIDRLVESGHVASDRCADGEAPLGPAKSEWPPILSRRLFLLAGVAGVAAAAVGDGRSQSTAESAAGVVPKDLRFPPGDVRRYGAILDGETDDAEALADWAKVGGDLVFPIPGTARITAAIRLNSNTTITGVAGATIETSTADISFLTASGQSDIRIRGLHFKQTKGGTRPYVGAVVLNRCSRCTVENCEFEGMQWAGVQLDNSSRCQIRGNHFHDWLGDVQDASDVCVYNASNLNIIDNNRMDGGCSHGILCQDPYSGLVPKENVFSNNDIGRHTAYGITIYCPGKGDAGDSMNRAINNRIENIEGSLPRNPSSGAGIYVVGAWAGGTQIVGNQIVNCCQRTLQRSLAPAGIGISGISSAVTRPIIKDNVITAMSQGDGILIVGSGGGGEISGGRVEMPAANDGTGAGGPALKGCGIRIENSGRVAVQSVEVICNGAGDALLVYANGAAVSEVAINGGSCTADGSGAALRSVGIGVGTIRNLSVTATRHTALNAATAALQLANVDGGTLANASVVAGALPALYITNCSNLHVSGGSYSSAGPIVVRTAGHCAGSAMDHTVDWGGAADAVDNAGVSFKIDRTGDAPPTGGTWAIGDHIRRRQPDTAAPNGWHCIRAGTPGVWVVDDVR
jgi:parallel beta-helix repeat protein